MSSPNKSRAAKWFGRLLFALAALVTLIILFRVEENWRGERDWTAYKQQMESKGRKFNPAAILPPRVPDDQNFAMTPFLAPLFDLQPGTNTPRDTNAFQRASDFGKSLPNGPQQPRGGWDSPGEKTDLVDWRTAFLTPAYDKPLKAQRHTAREYADAAPAVLTALKPYDAVIDELRTASRRPHAHFNINYTVENPVAITLPHLTTLRRVARILELRASSELALGRTPEAMDDVQLMFRLADSIQDEPMLVSHLVRIACLHLATEIVWEGLVDHRWSEAQLQALQNRLQNQDLLADFARAMEGERCVFGNGIFELLMKSSSRGQFLQAISDGSPSPAGRLLLAIPPRGWWRFEQLNYHRTLDDMLQSTLDLTARRVHPSQSRNHALAFDQSSTHPIKTILQHRALLHLICPALDVCLKRFACAQVTMDEAVLACALERCRLADGKYPDSLNALVPRFMAKLPHDIISGEPLKYHRDGDGYLLYSVGWNEKDDGGKSGTKTPPACEDGDWIWQFPAKLP